MGEISKPTERTHYVAYGPGGVIHQGVTEPNQATTTGQPSFIYNADPEVLAGDIEAGAIVDRFPTLPYVGEPVDADVIYNWSGSAVVCIQSHNRTIYSAGS